MSEDRRFERDARAWLELGPTDAPDRVVEAALIEIDSTSQERDFGVPWRLPIMSMTSRVAAAAIVVVVAVGVTFVFFRPSASGVGSPSPSPQLSVAPTATEVSGVTIAAFKSARDAICSAGLSAKAPLAARYAKLFESTASDADRADALAALDEFIALGKSVTDQLEALQPPLSIATEQTANVTQYRDVLTLLRYESKLLHAGDAASGQAVDLSTDEFSRQISAWERSYNFNDCP